MGFGGGGSTSSIGTSTDVAISNPADTQVLTYDGAVAKWKNATAAGGAVSSSQITDATAVGQSVLTAASTTAARTAIGAGTSSLALGTTGTTAKAGNYAPTADQVSETTTNKVMTAAERTKLTGVATGATANATDVLLRDRTTHTGLQAIATVTSLQTELNARETLVRWSGTAWAARPSGAPFGVAFISTNDANAPSPPTTGLLVGDIWRKHPDAA